MTTPNDAPLTESEIAAFPRYIAWVNTRQFYLCSKLADALEWRGTAGALVYEPLAYSTAELLDVRDQLAAANERIAEYEKHYARERYVNELADYRTMEHNWKERDEAVTRLVAAARKMLQEHGKPECKHRIELRAALAAFDAKETT